MIRLNISVEPRDAAYRDLLRVATEYCDEGLVVTRPSLEIDDHARSFLERLRPFLVNVQESSEWPGTVLYDEKATLYTFSYNDFAMKLLISKTSGLYEWQQPSLPEDLCLFSREERRPWLVTIAHERDAYIDVTRDVMDALMPKMNNIKVDERQT